MWETFFDLIVIAFVITVMHDGLLQGTLPLSICLTVKLKCFCSEPYPLADDRKEKINTSLFLRLAILGNICKVNGLFTLFPCFPIVSDL